MEKKPLLINGEWVETSHAISNINPSDTSDVIAEYFQAGRAEMQSAIEAGKTAFETWSHSTPQQRHDVLKKAGDEIMQRSAEIGELLSREEGKTLAEGKGETIRAAQIFDFFAGEALRLTGDIVPSVRPNLTAEISREPLGVVGVITPWNFPIAIPAWKIAPAICYGNTVVLKPAELVPGCSWVLADILHRAGLPAGVLNLVTGPGSVVGNEMVENPEVAAITFTGSQATGAAIAQKCVSRFCKFQLEMGGKNPMVVLDDADLDNAVECAVNGAFFSTGQRCTASSRLIVTEGIYSQFIGATIERLRSLKIDNALKPDTDIGPVVDQTQLDQDVEYIEIARKDGASIRFGGELLRRDTEGFYLSPALITETSNDMRINREEVFGPVASVIRVKDYEEALAVANDTEFGLSAGICTGSLKHATHFKRNSQAGMVMVNVPTAGVDYHVPFGGTKGSSYGAREQGSYAKEFYTTVKTAYTAAV
ncbi:MAG: aldehyde dehydrogenase family protein [Pseudomonadota bacterium]